MCAAVGGVKNNEESLSLGRGADIFEIKNRLEIPESDGIELYSKHSDGNVNFFAVVIKSSGDLLLICDHTGPFDETAERGWTFKHIPWFDDPAKRISALTFDKESILFLGSWDGSVYEIHVRQVLGLKESSDTDLREVCHLSSIRVLNILVYNQEDNKIVLCNGENGKFVIMTNHLPPVVVTFTSHILGSDLFVNKTGLTCALICLESGQNVYTILDDLDFPAIHNESLGKRSIFKKAKDNLMSRLSEEKLGFFGKKSNKEGGSLGSSLTNVNNSMLTSSGTNQSKSTPVPLTNVKFQSIDEVSCRGLVRKIPGRSQFVRHVITNKLDLFDEEFRQTASVFVPTYLTKVFVINKLYFGIDESNQCMTVSVLNNAVLKEFAVIPFLSRILSVEACGEESNPYSVFIVAEDGIHEMHLRKTPLETCVDLLLSETNNTLLEAACSALNVPKNQVCVLAGDVRSQEGKFSKTIIYYKLAGLTYAQICAKFGSRGQIPAMLFFFELVDQERTKLAGGSQDRNLMADLALLGRMEQFLRNGLVRSALPRNPESLLRKMLINNVHYSSKKAAESLAIPELMWALKVIAESRKCYPEIIDSLHRHDAKITPYCFRKKLFWNLLTFDWLSIYSSQPAVFFWFRSLVLLNLKHFTTPMLLRLLRTLVPWRRELQRKIFTEISDLINIIDFTVSPDVDRVVIDDYITLFLILLLEAVKRKSKPLILPHFTYKSDARVAQKQEIANHKHNMVATMLLSYAYAFVKSFSASGNHCVCVRNGKVFTWGENKLGRLGIGEERARIIIDTPTPISLSPSLRIHIESVCAGHSHNLALTNFGTILVWGSNRFGQLGLGKKTCWTGRPIPLDIPNVIFTCIAAGNYHSVAIDHLNRVWTWGWGVYGQLGNGTIENAYWPTIMDIREEKAVFVSAGHSHTAILTCYGKVLICGCNHFGQLGLGIKEGKVKNPKMITSLPAGTIIRLVECGVCSTIMVTTKNRLFYTGLNPASLKSLISGSRRKERPNHAIEKPEEEKDFIEASIIDTSHMAGDISKISAASTHFAVMTSLGYVYTWGIGKSGQLVRPEDDTKTLELIDCDERMMIASDICCAGDCTFVIERDSGNLFGCGFNSSGQLGKMETEDEQSIMTVRTKKRVVKIRQPSNIYFRLREVPGLPKQMSWEGENSIVCSHKISPSTDVVGQDLLEWCLNVFRRNYDAKFMTSMCLNAGNFSAASVLETFAENHEQALKHHLAAASSHQGETENSIGTYLDTVGSKSPTVDQAIRFLVIVINHWSKNNLSSTDLEDLLEKYRNNGPWGPHLNFALKEIISTADDSAEWIAANLTPLFILGAIKESQSPVFKISDSSTKVVGSLVSSLSPSSNGQVSDSEASSSENITSVLNRNGKVNGRE